MIKQTNQYL